MQTANFNKTIFRGTVWSLIDNFARQMITLISVQWRQYMAAVGPSLLASFVMMLIVLFAAEFLEEISVSLQLLILILTGAIAHSIVLYFVMSKKYRKFF